MAGETVVQDNVDVCLMEVFSEYIKGHVCFVCVGVRAKCQTTPLHTYVGGTSI